ncbi:unnamed protein product [Clonostachys chloroleuca]|uniref:Uncharacterized protein n=1 Tax=Clonostachys chloroleuca TaxID=1926264 RepID=A0AA35LRG2_9HYPO|nr:unnamed protein product [Clonostachys chloroleuca]
MFEEMQQDKVFFGEFEVPVSCLRFVHENGERWYDEDQAGHLESVFRKSSINFDDDRNWMNGYVDYSEAESILQQLNLSAQELRSRNHRGLHSFLDGRTIWYIHGRHRVKAARSIDPSQVWMVKIWLTKMSGLRSNKAINKEHEWFQHETPFTDAHIYRKLRDYRSQPKDYAEWETRLRPSRLKGFRSIIKRKEIRQILDSLMQSPLLDGLHLASFTKYFGLGLDDMIIQSLAALKHAWADHGDLDLQTVRELEGRSPRSSSDRQYIKELFCSGRVFSMVTKLVRRAEISQKVCNAPGTFPGFRSFHAKMNFLSTAAQIITKHIVPEDLLGKERELSTILLASWTETEPVVEVREGVFQRVRGPPSFSLAFNVLLVSILREFAYISNESTKVIRKRAPPSNGKSLDERFQEHRSLYRWKYLSLVRKRAKLLGFRVRLEEHPIVNVSVPPSYHHGLEPEGQEIADLLQTVDHRWGRPFTSVFLCLQRSAFLPQIMNHKTTEVDALSVFQELVGSLLKPCHFEIDEASPAFSIDDRIESNSNVQIISLPDQPYTFPRGDSGAMDIEVEHEPDASSSDTVMEDVQTQPAAVTACGGESIDETGKAEPSLSRCLDSAREGRKGASRRHVDRRRRKARRRRGNSNILDKTNSKASRRSLPLNTPPRETAPGAHRETSRTTHPQTAASLEHMASGLRICHSGPSSGSSAPEQTPDNGGCASTPVKHRIRQSVVGEAAPSQSVMPSSRATRNWSNRVPQDKVFSFSPNVSSGLPSERGNSVSGLRTPSRSVAPVRGRRFTGEAATELSNLLSEEGIFHFPSTTSSGPKRDSSVNGIATPSRSVVPTGRETFMCAAPSNVLPQEGTCPFSPAASSGQPLEQEGSVGMATPPRSVVPARRETYMSEIPVALLGVIPQEEVPTLPFAESPGLPSRDSRGEMAPPTWSIMASRGVENSDEAAATSSEIPPHKDAFPFSSAVDLGTPSQCPSIGGMTTPPRSVVPTRRETYIGEAEIEQYNAPLPEAIFPLSSASSSDLSLHNSLGRIPLRSFMRAYQGGDTDEAATAPFDVPSQGGLAFTTSYKRDDYATTIGCTSERRDIRGWSGDHASIRDIIRHESPAFLFRYPVERVFATRELYG